MSQGVRRRVHVAVWQHCFSNHAVHRHRRCVHRRYRSLMAQAGRTHRRGMHHGSDGDDPSRIACTAADLTFINVHLPADARPPAAVTFRPLRA